MRFLFLFLALPLSLLAQNRQIITYYDAQQQTVKEKYFITGGRPVRLEGTYESFFANGKLQAKGNYRKNLPEGPWEYFYENGKPKMAGELRQNVRQGNWKFYFESGNLQSEGPYLDGQQHGLWKFYFENGQLKSEGFYQQDQKTGVWKYYYEDGKLKAETEYFENKAFYREFSPIGKPLMDGWLQDGKSDSTWRHYHENGALKATGSQKNGQKTGNWKFYHPSGYQMSEGEYRDDVPNGTWRYFHANGKIAAEGIEVNGLKEGSWNFYASNGEKKAIAKLDSGAGVQEMYYPSGKLKARGMVKNDWYEGEWQYFREEDGSVEGNCTFTNGRGIYTGYYPDGKVRMKGMLENDRRIGEWTLYRPDGQIAGYYRAVYEEMPSAKPLLDSSHYQADQTQVRVPGLPYKKPPIRLPRRKIRYFTPRPNEFRGFIVGINPLALGLKSLPFSVEYYLRERLGYEITASIYRNPFLNPDQAVDREKAFYRGYSVGFRQKFYQPDEELGMFYFGHEIRFTDLDHRAYVTNNAGPGPAFRQTIQADETRYEYSLLVGNRWMQDPGSRGITFDIFGGVGIGYRRYRPQWENNPGWDKLFKDVRKSHISVPIRLGFTLGYAF